MSEPAVSEETARRIAEALERLIPALEAYANALETRVVYQENPNEPLVSKDQTSAARHEGEVVYFIRSGGLIKIGTTTNLSERLRTIHLHGPGAVLVRAYPGGRALERKMHEAFHACRRHGEWFDLAPEWQIVADGLAGGPPL